MITVCFVLEFYEPYINATLGSYTKYYLILVIFVLLNYYGFKIAKDKIAGCFILWFLYKCVSLIWSQNYEMFHLHFLTNITTVVLLYLLVMYPFDESTLKVITNSLWLGSGSIGVLSLISNAPYLGVSNRIVLKLFGVTIDPNNNAAFLAVGIAVSLYYIFVSEENKIYKLLSVAIIFINTYTLLLTGSRGGLLTVLWIIVILVLFYLQKGKHKIIFILGITLLFIAFQYLAQNYLPNDVYLRLFQASTYEGGSERTEIWSNAFELMNSNFLFYIFGSGWGSYYGYNNFYVAMHNTYLSIFCDTGAIGMILFFIPIAKGVLYLSKEKKILPILLLVAGLVPAFFLESINKRFFWNAIIIFLMFYKYQYYIHYDIEGDGDD